MKESIWTDKLTERLYELRDFGMNMQLIANRLSVETGLQITKNAVIGRLTRTNYKYRPIKVSESVVEIPDKDKIECVKEATYKRKISETRQISLHGANAVLSLRKEQCRWPIGDIGSNHFCFCNENAVDGKSYCAKHSRIAYVPIVRRFRKANIKDTK